MFRSMFAAAATAALAGGLTLHFLSAPHRQVEMAATGAGGNAVSGATQPGEAWPICSAIKSLAESADWAALDPEFAAGKRALAAADWKGAISTLTAAGLRDDRNADIQNYIGYAYHRLLQLDPAIRHYQQALNLNPRHRSAHEHLGEAYLMQGNPAKAQEQLAALGQICLIPCDEYDDLNRAIAGYSTALRR
jgi:tetratricopeptide (TPR) repeat protein